MKYIAALALVGAIQANQAEAMSLVQLNSATEAGLWADFGSDDETLVQLEAPCVYLDETQEELDYQVDMFSRTLDARHWTNAVNIQKQLKKKTGQEPRLQVHTWELYDKAFVFPRVRRYGYVNENMDMLEHFEDNLNTNVTNERNMANFLRTAMAVRQNFNTKYHDGEFDDPGNHDPWLESLQPRTWSGATVTI